MDILGFIGGLSFFLFGMNVMETGLKNISGDKIKNTLTRISGNTFKGVTAGIIITAVIQSSSAVTVSLIGLCEAELLSFFNSIPIIIGANIGTSVTAWIISLSVLSADNFIFKILTPSTLCTFAGFIGVFFIILSKNNKRIGTGLIMTGFSLIMNGINSMSSAMENIADTSVFKSFLSLLNNPFSALLFGIIMTAVIQSSSASVGILQSLCAADAFTIYNVTPIILGQNIGTCITSVIASIGGSKESKKICIFHIIFNLAGSVLWFIGLIIVNRFISLNRSVSSVDIAVIHTAFNLSTGVIFSVLHRNFLSRLKFSSEFN